MMKLLSNLAFAEFSAIIKSDGQVCSSRLRFKSAGTHRFGSIDTFSAWPWLLMLGFASFYFLTHSMCVKGLRMALIFKNSLTDVLEIFVVIVLIEGIFFEWSILVLDGAFVAIHTLSFKLILIIKYRSSIKSPFTKLNGREVKNYLICSHLSLTIIYLAFAFIFGLFKSFFLVEFVSFEKDLCFLFSINHIWLLIFSILTVVIISYTLMHCV